MTGTLIGIVGYYLDGGHLTTSLHSIPLYEVRIKSVFGRLYGALALRITAGIL